MLAPEDEVVIVISVQGTMANTSVSSTRSDLANMRRPSNGTLVYVLDVNGVYEFDTGATDSANGWTVISALDGTTGRWLYASRTMRLPKGLGNGVRVDDGAMSASSTTLTCASAPFSQSAIGKAIVVIGAGAAGAPLVTTIATVLSTTVAHLTDAAGTAVSAAEVLFGTGLRAVFQAACDATAAAGVVLTLGAERYVIEGTVTTASDLHLSLCPDTIITGAIAQRNDETANIFETLKPTPTATTTIAGAIPRDAYTFDVASAVVAEGDIVRLVGTAPENVNQQYIYRAVSVSGSTVTVERPIQFPFPNGSGVQVLPYWPENVVIEGSGLFDGSADSAVHVWAAHDCLLEGFRCEGAFKMWPVIFDAGGLRNVMRDVRTVRGAGIGVDCNEAWLLDRTDSQRSTSHAYWLWDGTDGVLFLGRGNGAAAQGINLTSNGASAHGPLRTRIIGGNYDCNVAGLVLTSPAQGCSIDGASVQGCAAFAIGNIDANNLGHQELEIINCDLGPGTVASQATTIDGIGYALPAVLAQSGARMRIRGGRIIAAGPPSVGSGIPQAGVSAQGMGTTVEVLGVDVQVDALSDGVTYFFSFEAGQGATVCLDVVLVRGALAGDARTFGLLTAAADGTGIFRLGRVDISTIPSDNQRFGTGTFAPWT